MCVSNELDHLDSLECDSLEVTCDFFLSFNMQTAVTLN